MGKIISVKVSNIHYWLENFRFSKVMDQKDAEKQLCNTKGFNKLVKSITENGFLENHLLTVSRDKQNPDYYLVYDGNRRLAAIQQIPSIQEINVYLEEDATTLNMILQIEHSQHPANRLRWTPVQQARFDRSCYEQEIQPFLSKQAVSLAILEKTLGESVNPDFSLSTFERILSEKNAYKSFGIDKSDIENINIQHKDALSNVILDIKDKKVTSRNTNTAGNIKRYIESTVKGDSQEERIKKLKEDADDADNEEDYNRLFSNQDVEILKTHINNEEFFKELERAPLGRYPHLLCLAIRSVLDTMGNIMDDKLNSPVALNPDIARKLLNSNHAPKIKDSNDLINSLGKLAHNINQKASVQYIENNRELTYTLINLMSDRIEKKKL